MLVTLVFEPQFDVDGTVRADFPRLHPADAVHGMRAVAEVRLGGVVAPLPSEFSIAESVRIWHQREGAGQPRALQRGRFGRTKNRRVAMPHAGDASTEVRADRQAQGARVEFECGVVGEGCCFCHGTPGQSLQKSVWLILRRYRDETRAALDLGSVAGLL